MAQPEPRPPAQEDAVDILRRLEPVLLSMDERIKSMEAEQKDHRARLERIEAEQAEQRKQLAEMAGRIKALEVEQQSQSRQIAHLQGQVSQLPNIWQFTAALLALFSVIFAVAGGLVAVLRYIF
jgi:flagellar biosynthesis chaperone FliJ